MSSDFDHYGDAFYCQLFLDTEGYDMDDGCRWMPPEEIGPYDAEVCDRKASFAQLRLDLIDQSYKICRELNIDYSTQIHSEGINIKLNKIETIKNTPKNNQLYKDLIKVTKQMEIEYKRLKNGRT